MVPGLEQTQVDLFKAASGEWGLLHSCGKVTLA